jgi:flavin reductase (DIM6/NTAB) family NADH-FMN oxidoreductase RutF
MQRRFVRGDVFVPLKQADWENSPVDEDAKKIALRMIPYGIYVLTAEAPDGRTAAATVNWVTQTSFKPPLIAVAVKADSTANAVVGDAGIFALNVLGKDQPGVAFAFFKPVERSGDMIGDETVEAGETGVPLLASAAAAVECRVVEIVAQGDHHIVVGEVIHARVNQPPSGRPDEAVLEMKNLGENVFYGG